MTRWCLRKRFILFCKWWSLNTKYLRSKLILKSCSHDILEKNLILLIPKKWVFEDVCTYHKCPWLLGWWWLWHLGKNKMQINKIFMSNLKMLLHINVDTSIISRSESINHENWCMNIRICLYHPKRESALHISELSSNYFRQQGGSRSFNGGGTKTLFKEKRWCLGTHTQSGPLSLQK